MTSLFSALPLFPVVVELAIRSVLDVAMAQATHTLRLLQQSCLRIERTEVRLAEIVRRFKGVTLLRASQIIPRDLGHPSRGVQEPRNWKRRFLAVWGWHGREDYSPCILLPNQAEPRSMASFLYSALNFSHVVSPLTSSIMSKQQPLSSDARMVKRSLHILISALHAMSAQ